MKKLIILLLAASLLPLAGCKKSSEKAAEKLIESQTGGKAEVDISEGKITITSKEKGREGTLEFSGGKDLRLPPSFPKDVPVYPEATVIAQMSAGPDNQQVTFRSDERSGEVYDFYLAKLRKEGWEIVSEIKMAPSYNLVAKKGGRQAAVVIVEDGKKSTISINLSGEKG